VRVLFLDIDGVLNSRDYVERAGWEPPLGSDHDVHIIDPAAVALLNLIVESTGAFIVISSSWRITYGTDALHSMLELRGFTGRVIGVTPQRSGRQRSREIAEWLAENRVEAFAIVDDENDAGVGYTPRFVQTSFEEGLTREHASKLVRVLTTPLRLSSSAP
jgi:hypothetical protein